eukprot:559713-Hanusia_phi.AAC.1
MMTTSQGVDSSQASAIFNHFQSQDPSISNETSLNSTIGHGDFAILKHAESFQKIFRRAERKWKR